MDVLWADLSNLLNLSKNYEICPLAIPKQISTISMLICTYQVWWKSIDIYWSYHPEMKVQTCRGQTTQSKIDEICPSAIPNQVSTIPMHIPSKVKIRWHLLKLSSGNENTDVFRADNSVKNWRNLPINNPKPDLHNINAHTEFGRNPLKFTQVIIWKQKYGQMDERTYGRRTDTRTANVIP